MCPVFFRWSNRALQQTHWCGRLSSWLFIQFHPAGSLPYDVKKMIPDFFLCVYVGSRVIHPILFSSFLDDHHGLGRHVRVLPHSFGKSQGNFQFCLLCVFYIAVLFPKLDDNLLLEKKSCIWMIGLAYCERFSSLGYMHVSAESSSCLSARTLAYMY